MSTDTTSARSPEAAWARFRTYWFGLTVSTIGDSFTLVALPVAAYAASRSSVLVGLVDMMEILSGIALGSLLGAVADRSDPRTVMAWSDAVRAALLVALATMAALGSWNAPALLGLAFGLGALRAFHDGAESALLVVIIPTSREMQAFARISSADSVARLIGPFVGGLTLEIGLWAAFGVDAMTFVAAALVVLGLPRRPAPTSSSSTGSPSLRDDLRETVRALRDRPTYLAVVGIAAFGNLAGLTTAGFFVPFADQVLGLRSLGLQFGLLLSLMGLGGLLANVVTNRQQRIDVRGAGLGNVALGASVLLCGAVPSVATAIVAMVVTGFALGYFAAHYTAYRQQVFEPSMLGRVAMVSRTILYTTMIVGFLGGGPIADHFGPDVLLVVAGAVSVIGCAVIGFLPIDLDPEVRPPRPRRRGSLG